MQANLKKAGLSTLILLAFVKSAFCTTYYSASAGDLNNTSSWNTVRTGGGSNPSNFTSGDIFVVQTFMSSSSNWTVSGTGSEVIVESTLYMSTINITVEKLTVLAGGLVQLESGRTLTINNGNASGDDLSVSGTIKCVGTITYGTGATGIINNGGVYKHSKNGGTILTATWASGATCEIDGCTTINPSGLNQSFYHFTWNSASMTSDVTTGGSLTTINGNFTVQNTGSAQLRIANGGSSTLTILGNLVITSGASLNLAVGTGNPTFNVSGNLTVNGTLTENISASGVPTVKFANNGTQTLTNTGTISNQINFIVNSGSTLSMGTNVLSGTGTFTLSSGASLNIGHASGITSSASSGNIQVTGTRTYSTSANYTYNGSGTQVFGDGLPATVNNLTISNGNTAMALPASLTVNGSLTLTSGCLTIGSNTLTLNGSYSGSAANFISANGSSSNLSIGGSGSLGTLYVDQATPGTTNAFNNLVVNRSGLTLILGGALNINGLLTLTSGKISVGSNTLTLNGDFSGSASNCLAGNGSSSNLIIGGSGSIGTLYFDQSVSGTTNRLLNFTVNRSGQTITLGNRLEIRGTVSPDAGTLSSGGNLVLVSNASGDARIANTTGTVSGNVTVQKYIPAGSHRRWIQLGSPVSGFVWDSLKSYIFITGGSGSTGFDANSSGRASANTYDETISGTCAKNGWVYPASPAVSVPAGTGMRVYYRGDRSDPTVLTSNLSATPVATTLNFIGNVNSGTISPAVSCTNTGTGLTDDGWNFIANPYPSAIDWNAASGWSKSGNISSQISVWDPGNKRYATWDGTNSVNGGSRYIAMGQGFWIKANSYSATSLSMDERVKVSNTPPQFFKMSSAGSAKLRVTYIRDTATTDEALICFDKKWDNAYDSLVDCVKLLNEDLSIWSLTSDGEKVVINYRSLPLAGDTIKLSFNTSEGGIHQMQFSDYELLPSNIYPFLIDQYSHKKINIRDLKEPYRFLVNSDTASTSDTRFYIVFADAASPVQLNVLVSPDSTQALLKWSSGNELGTQKYEVEYSNDTLSFQAIETVLPASGPGFDSAYYQLPNVSLTNGINYFRIRKVNDNNAPCYSNIQSVEIPQNTTSVHTLSLRPVKMLLYPTMANDKIILVFDRSVSFSNARIDVYSTSGEIVKSADLVYPSDKKELNVSGLAPGIYYITVCNGQSTYKAKFIKTSVK